METDLVKVLAPHDLSSQDRVCDADNLHSCIGMSVPRLSGQGLIAGHACQHAQSHSDT